MGLYHWEPTTPSLPPPHTLSLPWGPIPSQNPTPPLPYPFPLTPPGAGGTKPGPFTLLPPHPQSECSMLCENLERRRREAEDLEEHCTRLQVWGGLCCHGCPLEALQCRAGSYR